MEESAQRRTWLDLNTKTLSLRRRQTLLRRCGCRGDGIPEGDDEDMQLGGQQKQLVRAVYLQYTYKAVEETAMKDTKDLEVIP